MAITNPGKSAEGKRAIERWENEGGKVPATLRGREGSVPGATGAMKRLVIFDLDGTLAESKASLDAEMAALLGTLLGRVKVAVISGGDWPQFETQLIARLPTDERLENLSLLPTCGTKFYRFESGWKQLYSEGLTDVEKEKIIRSLKESARTEGVAAEAAWGEQIEDRGSQITFSALGQQAPLEQKEKWDRDYAKRKKMKAHLERLIPEFTVRLGGTTSVDVTKLGIDKGFGIRKLREILGVEIDEMMFAGDALFPGGNDYPVKEAGVTSIRVNNSEETKRVIETILACTDGVGHTAPREEAAR